MVDPPPPKFVSGYAADLRTPPPPQAVDPLDRRRRGARARRGVTALVVSVRENPVYLAVVVGDNTSGPDSGQQIVQAATWAVDTWNEANPTADHELRLVTFYDDNDPETGEADRRRRSSPTAGSSA